MCFRHEESSSVTPESEIVKDKLSEELLKPELNPIDDGQKDWIWRLRKVGFSLPHMRNDLQCLNEVSLSPLV